jgi:hypothetical protein
LVLTGLMAGCAGSGTFRPQQQEANNQEKFARDAQQCFGMKSFSECMIAKGWNWWVTTVEDGKPPETGLVK